MGKYVLFKRDRQTYVRMLKFLREDCVKERRRYYIYSMWIRQLSLYSDLLGREVNSDAAINTSFL